VPFFKADCFVTIEEKVACCLSSLFGLASSYFSQKFAKVGDCWIFYVGFTFA